MPQPVSSFFSDVADWFKNLLSEEPAHAVGAVAAVLTLVASKLDLAGVHSWQAILPVVLAAVIRQFVFSPGTFNRSTDVIGQVARLVLEDVKATPPPTEDRIPPSA